MSDRRSAERDKSLSLSQARRASKTLVEMVIGIIGLCGLLMAQLGHSDQIKALRNAVVTSGNSKLVQVVTRAEQSERRLVTFLPYKRATGECQSNWLSLL